MNNSDISSQNETFWNVLCGSGAAQYLGITDTSPASLKKFDDWYFDIYPYLFDHIPFTELRGKDVLEVGLGYGTVAQKLAESGAIYQGLDIASGPVAMVNHRLNQTQLPGKAVQGSILEPPFSNESFDAIVAIGCLHHTGDLQLAINNCLGLLRPGGRLIFMVYYAYSYRRFRMAPITTLKYLLKESDGYRGVVGGSSVRERAAYDGNSESNYVPHTDWISIRSLRILCSRFTEVSTKLENISQEAPFGYATREKLLSSRWPNIVGLDLYATAIK